MSTFRIVGRTEVLEENASEARAVRHEEILDVLVSRLEACKGRELTDEEFERVSRLAYTRACAETR